MNIVRNISTYCKIAITVFFSSMFMLSMGIGCAKKTQEAREDQVTCYTHKNYGSVAFEVEGDMAELVEKTAKKTLAKSCFKKSDQSNANMRIKIQSTQTLHSESGFIKDKYDNSFSVTIVAIMLIPTQQGGLTTIQSKQNGNLNLKSAPIADFGSKSELSEKELTPFIEKNVQTALENLLKEMP